MALWKWVKEKALGETVKDYGLVLEWPEGGATRTLHVQLTRKERRFFLAARLGRSGLLSRQVEFLRVDVNAEDLRRIARLASDAAETLAHA